MDCSPFGRERERDVARLRARNDTPHEERKETPHRRNLLPASHTQKLPNIYVWCDAPFHQPADTYLSSRHASATLPWKQTAFPIPQVVAPTPKKLLPPNHTFFGADSTLFH
ncbi:hypothetical protein HPB48_000126 [Haemaphysalis longicornis]|uniref:Uncharacterized protein n=1 Tax=Haemaphysalis longicornis TaxID=44386 RepID=A0A9J6GIK2_HAELO|nr:hypothetical protein HPB48_000126 [Haemaphysalis longicornis]